MLFAPLLCLFCLHAIAVEHVPRRGHTVREEPADACWGEARRSIEQEFAQTFEARQSDKRRLNTIAKNKDTTPGQQSAALGQLMGLALAESLGRFNHGQVMLALKNDCRERQQRIDDPCTTAHYDARQNKCVVSTRHTPECLAKRRELRRGRARAPRMTLDD